MTSNNIVVIKLSDITKTKGLILSADFYVKEYNKVVSKMEEIKKNNKFISLQKLIKKSKVKYITTADIYGRAIRKKQYVYLYKTGDVIVDLNTSTVKLMLQNGEINKNSHRNLFVLDKDKLNQIGIDFYYISALFNSTLYKIYVKDVLSNKSNPRDIPIILLDNKEISKVSLKEKKRLEQIKKAQQEIQKLSNQHIIDL